MGDLLSGILIGVVGVGVVLATWRLARRGRSKAAPKLTVENFVTEMRAVGELSVYRVMTKEVISASDHWLGEFGKKYLGWLISSERITLIMEFDVDFRYDLTDPAFSCERIGPEACRITLPPCRYEVLVRDMKIHSEDKPELLPWLMPDLVGRFFTGGFSVEAKNKLIAETRRQSRQHAAELVGKVQSEARASAIRSLTSLTQGFGLEKVDILFLEAAAFDATVDSTPLEQSMGKLLGEGSDSL
jgi:hypothetical protein